MAKARGKKRIFAFVRYALFAVVAVDILYPLFFIFISSLKSNTELFSRPWSLPAKWDLGIYVQVWTDFQIGTYFFNSLYYAAASVAITLLVAAMAAYGISRMKWRLSGFAMGLFLLGLMVPIHSELVPLYIGFTKAGLTNPRITLVGLYVAFSLPISIFILSGYLRSIPRELEESAVLEGCSIVRTFWTIVFPLMVPALATVSIFNFLTGWNDFLTGLIFIRNEADKTLQLGIMRFQGTFSTRYSALLAAIIITILPSALVYFVMQDKIVSGVTAGAVKG
jgi:raffinose/stachyose/melibiose transport system permease protein